MMSDDYLIFADLRNRCKRLKNDWYEHFIRLMETNDVDNPHQFWNFISTIRKDPHLPSSMFLDKVYASGGMNIANSLLLGLFFLCFLRF